MSLITNIMGSIIYTRSAAVSGWYNPTTFQIYENKQITEGEQINELN